MQRALQRQNLLIAGIFNTNIIQLHIYVHTVQKANRVEWLLLHSLPKFLSRAASNPHNWRIKMIPNRYLWWELCGDHLFQVEVNGGTLLLRDAGLDPAIAVEPLALGDGRAGGLHLGYRGPIHYKQILMQGVYKVCYIIQVLEGMAMYGNYIHM